MPVRDNEFNLPHRLGPEAINVGANQFRNSDMSYRVTYVESFLIESWLKAEAIIGISHFSKAATGPAGSGTINP
jgi:hypothetical protein